MGGATNFIGIGIYHEWLEEIWEVENHTKYINIYNLYTDENAFRPVFDIPRVDVVELESGDSRRSRPMLDENTFEFKMFIRYLFYIYFKNNGHYSSQLDKTFQTTDIPSSFKDNFDSFFNEESKNINKFYEIAEVLIARLNGLTNPPGKNFETFFLDVIFNNINLIINKAIFLIKHAWRRKLLYIILKLLFLV